MSDEMKRESDMRDVKAGISELKGMFRQFALSLSKTNHEMASLRDYVHEKLVTRGEFNDRMDAYAGKFDDRRFDWAKQQARLDEHDKRLNRLEGRRE